MGQCLNARDEVGKGVRCLRDFKTEPSLFCRAKALQNSERQFNLTNGRHQY